MQSELTVDHKTEKQNKIEGGDGGMGEEKWRTGLLGDVAKGRVEQSADGNKAVCLHGHNCVARDLPG